MRQDATDLALWFAPFGIVGDAGGLIPEALEQFSAWGSAVSGEPGAVQSVSDCNGGAPKGIECGAGVGSRIWVRIPWAHAILNHQG